ncbi:hypothetical protein GIS00_05575 [Nakamurella sp. YIM 132087]|uniref:FAS1-like dehydratase domain-containing protein n=1 Tax=Nakamurella alba TaxID=2665158 RepID=A0A7K1FJI1_9ACTN|nr:MaoC family dehydratase N-terminal domain-containing protein [Nakamurella alba]MTD13413.1 hypothetical protein [Nakamurella alba]
MIGIDELRAELLATELPDGEFRIEGYESWLFTDCTAATPDVRSALAPGTAHPMLMFVAGMRGVGYTVEGLFALAHCAMEDGPMIAGTDVRQLRGLRVGETVTVSSRITAVDRKSGRSGTFDLLTVEHGITAADGEPVGTLVDTLMCPRGGAR